jgi:hypothetical protein
LVPTAGAGEEPEPEPTNSIVAFASVALWSTVFDVAPSIAVFTVASSATVFTTATFASATSSVFFTAVASSVVHASTTFPVITDAAVEASLAVEVDLSPSDPPGALDATALGSG